MRKSLGYVLLIATSLTLLTSQVVTAKPNIMIPAFSAVYSIIHNSKSVGSGTRSLTYLDHGLAQYSYDTNIEWLIFSDNRQEMSQVKIDDGQVIPVNYQFIREGTGRDKSFHWHYDINNNKATNLEKKQEYNLDFPANIQDKLSYHLQLRFNMLKNPKQKNFVYPVIGNNGKMKNYVYQYDGEEEIMLPYGLVKTIRLKREVEEKKRVTYAWFAPELDYLLVKLYQSKGGVEQFEAQLKSLSSEK